MKMVGMAVKRVGKNRVEHNNETHAASRMIPADASMIKLITILYIMFIVSVVSEYRMIEFR